MGASVPRHAILLVFESKTTSPRLLFPTVACREPVIMVASSSTPLRSSKT